MADLPKRQTMIKGKGKRSDIKSDDTDEPVPLSDNLTPTESAVDMPTPRSRGSSFTDPADQAEQQFKQEHTSPSSDEAVDEDFQMDEDYQPPSTSSWRVKPAKKGAGKPKTERPHPYQRPERRPSKGQQPQPQQIPSASPEYATAGVQHHHSPVFDALSSSFGAGVGQMLTPPRDAHPDLNTYFGVASMPEDYHGVYTQAMGGYSMAPHHDGINGFHYAAMEG